MDSAVQNPGILITTGLFTIINKKSVIIFTGDKIRSFLIEYIFLKPIIIRFMKPLKALVFALLCSVFCNTIQAQYVEKERDDTVRLFPKTPYDSLAAIDQLARGTATIKGVAFTKPKTGLGYKAPLAARIYANKIKILIFPLTPYLEEYLELKKKENYKKLRFAYLSPAAWYYHYEAITNSDGEFTIPNLKPGKYYLEGVLNWNSSGSYDQYTGSGYNGYGGGTDYYERKYYTVGHADLLQKIVEITAESEVLKVKLK